MNLNWEGLLKFRDGLAIQGSSAGPGDKPRKRPNYDNRNRRAAVDAADRVEGANNMQLDGKHNVYEQGVPTLCFLSAAEAMHEWGQHGSPEGAL